MSNNESGGGTEHRVYADISDTSFAKVGTKGKTMKRIKTLEETPILAEFRNKVQETEKVTRRVEVSSYDLKLYLNGMLRIKADSVEGKFPVSQQAMPDLARLVDIPTNDFYLPAGLDFVLVPMSFADMS